jgi:hypothetical protein
MSGFIYTPLAPLETDLAVSGNYTFEIRSKEVTVSVNLWGDSLFDLDLIVTDALAWVNPEAADATTEEVVSAITPYCTSQDTCQLWFDGYQMMVSIDAENWALPWGTEMQLCFQQFTEEAWDDVHDWFKPVESYPKMSGDQWHKVLYDYYVDLLTDDNMFNYNCVDPYYFDERSLLPDETNHADANTWRMWNYDGMDGWDGEYYNNFNYNWMNDAALNDFYNDVTSATGFSSFMLDTAGATFGTDDHNRNWWNHLSWSTNQHSEIADNMPRGYHGATNWINLDGSENTLPLFRWPEAGWVHAYFSAPEVESYEEFWIYIQMNAKQAALVSIYTATAIAAVYM